MSPLEFELAAWAVAVVAGILGALLGLGGGIILVPALTVLLGVNIRYAIGAAIVAAIATSSGSALRYLREGLVNLRLALFLELAAVTGALTGATVAGLVDHRTLYFVFAAAAGLIGALMLLRRRPATPPTGTAPPPAPHPLGLAGTSFDATVGAQVPYRAERIPAGLALGFAAGAASGLLGVGGGFLKVPALHVAMKVPLKVATATSTFMIGVTAAASAGVYFHRGDVAACVAAPVALGVVLGAMLGSRLQGRIPPTLLRLLFVAVLVWIAGSMLAKGLGG